MFITQHFNFRSDFRIHIFSLNPCLQTNQPCVLHIKPRSRKKKRANQAGKAPFLHGKTDKLLFYINRVFYFLFGFLERFLTK